MARLLLVDGSSFLYRAFYAMGDLRSTQGAPTGAIYGFLSMLFKLEKEVSHDFFAVVMDAKGKNFRHQLFSQYKAQRPPMPQDLILQKEALLCALGFLGYPVLIKEKVEADDVLATLAEKARQENVEVVIASTDKDLMQLISPTILAFDAFKNQWVDEKSVVEKFGVSPQQIVDYLVLVGDSADNIPGVALCGPKTAVKWLKEWGNLNAIIHNAEKIKGVVGENLGAHLPFFNTAVQLVTLKKDVEGLPPITELKRKKIENENWKNFCKEFELWSFLKNSETEEEENYIQKEYLNIAPTQFKEFEKKINNAQSIAFYFNENPLQFSFAFEKNKVLTVDFPFDWVDENINNFFKNYSGDFVVGNIYKTLCFFKKYNLNLPQKMDDVEMMSFILYAGKYNSHSLTVLIQRYFSDLKSFRTEEYADFSLQLFWRFKEEFKNNGAQQSLYENLELPLVKVLFQMEENGVLMDVNLLKQQSQKMNLILNELEKQIFKESGEIFNLNSPKQLSDVLFQKLKLSHGKKTKSGIYSTNEDVLVELAGESELVALILQHRSLSKLKNTYVDKLPQMVNIHTQRIHTHFKQLGAVTGRLSSIEPNLQNIPIKTQEGKKIREAFIAPKGSLLLSADYSQIELRIMAHLSDDENLIQAFQNGEDIHKMSAAEIFNLPLQAITEKERRIAKSINFGLIYGMSAFGLSKQLGIFLKEAEKYIARYFKRYPKVAEYMHQTRENAIQNAYVETLFGRRLYLPDLYSQNNMKKKMAERAAINAPLQGSAADLIKRAMVDIFNVLNETKSPARLILQVHDELILEVPEAYLNETQNIVQKAMCSAAHLKVPLEISMAAAKNWASAH